MEFRKMVTITLCFILCCIFRSQNRVWHTVSPKQRKIERGERREREKGKEAKREEGRKTNREWMRLVQSLPEPHQLPRALSYSVYSYRYKEPVQVLNTKLFSQEGLLYCTQARSIYQSTYFLCFRVHTLCVCVRVCLHPILFNNLLTAGWVQYIFSPFTYCSSQIPRPFLNLQVST